MVNPDVTKWASYCMNCCWSWSPLRWKGSRTALLDHQGRSLGPATIWCQPLSLHLTQTSLACWMPMLEDGITDHETAMTARVRGLPWR